MLVNTIDRDQVRYWTFFNNPARWQFDRFLESGIKEFQYLIPDNWNQDYIKPGHLGVMRVGTDSRSKAILNGKPRIQPGVYAIIEVLTSPYPRTELEDDYWLTPRDHITGQPTVKLRIVKNLLNNPFLLGDLNAEQDDEHLIRGFEGRTMPLKESTFEKIIERVGGIDHSVFETEFNEAVNNAESLRKLDEKYADAAPQVRYSLSKKIERGKIGEYVKGLNNYECQVCKELGSPSTTFITRGTERNYVESHHVHGVHMLKHGSLLSNNIAVLCPLHHRQMHYGNVELTDETHKFFTFLIDGTVVRIKRLHY